VFTLSKRIVLNLALILLPTITGCVQSLPPPLVRFQDESCRGEIHLAFENVLWDANTTELTMTARTWQPVENQVNLFLDNKSYPFYQLDKIQVRAMFFKAEAQIRILLYMIPQPHDPSRGNAFYVQSTFTGSEMCRTDKQADELLVRLKNFKLKNFDDLSQTITINGTIAVRNEKGSTRK
jgi:hypothetical protein